jgi:hypothetical protein
LVSSAISGESDSFKNGREELASRTTRGLTSDFFVVKQAKHGNKRRFKRRIQKGGNSCVAGEEVVESGRSEE